VRDLLLHLDSYPEATSAEAIEQAVRFAAAARAELTALAVQIDIKAPRNWLANRLINLSGLCLDEEAKSLAHCRTALAVFAEKLKVHEVKGGACLTRADPVLMGEHVALHARTRDLCLVPITDGFDGQRAVAEAVVFQSGRPVLLYRPGLADLPGGELSTIVVAWDGSRAAARAMADALPVLRRSRRVRVLTVVNEKPGAQKGLGDDAVRHLKSHEIDATADDVDSEGRKIGQVLSDYVAAHRSDLLVMGAYGRSSVRDFILGGATEHLLKDPPVPLLLSH
jgi:nucleotide-binding universal stress UspA family protein